MLFNTGFLAFPPQRRLFLQAILEKINNVYLKLFLGLIFVDLKIFFTTKEDLLTDLMPLKALLVGEKPGFLRHVYLKRVASRYLFLQDFESTLSLYLLETSVEKQQQQLNRLYSLSFRKCRYDVSLKVNQHLDDEDVVNQNYLDIILKLTHQAEIESALSLIESISDSYISYKATSAILTALLQSRLFDQAIQVAVSCKEEALQQSFLRHILITVYERMEETDFCLILTKVSRIKPDPDLFKDICAKYCQPNTLSRLNAVLASIKRHFLKASVLLALSESYLGMNDADKALLCLNKLMMIVEKLTDRDQKIYLWLTLADHYQELGYKETCLLCLHKAYRNINRLQRTIKRTRYLLSLAETYDQYGYRDKAMLLCSQVKDLLASVNMLKPRISITFKLASLYFLFGEREQAFKLLKTLKGCIVTLPQTSEKDVFQAKLEHYYASIFY